MKIWKWLLGGLFVLVTLPGCGDDDPKTPVQQCQDLLNQFCDSGISCQVSGGYIESSEKASELATCKQQVGTVVDCSKAQRVTANYEACMGKLRNPPCDAVNQAILDGTLGLPTECNGVIEVTP